MRHHNPNMYRTTSKYIPKPEIISEKQKYIRSKQRKQYWILMRYSSLYMTLILINLTRDEQKISGKRILALQKDTENYIYDVNNQQGRLNENGKRTSTNSKIQENTTEIHRIHNQEREL